MGDWRRGCAVAAALAALTALSGCAPDGGAANAPSPTQTEAPAATPAPAPEPTPAPTPEELRHQRAVEIVASASTREKVGSIVMGTAGGVDGDALRAFADENALGGFILMGDNVPGSQEELATLTAGLSADPAYPLLIAIDQEGGVVSRLPWDQLPAADSLKYEVPEASESAFSERAALLSAAGVNVNFGIVADISAAPGEFIYDRALGTTPEDGAARVAAAVRGEQGSVFSTLKHFPGHGAAPGDSHSVIPATAMTLDEWRGLDAVPFAAGIEAGAELLMFGHLAYESVDPLPASLSPEWHRIAREDLGFSGVATTDDLGMLVSSGLPEYQDPAQNAARALNAGNDLLVFVVGSDPATLTATIDGVVQAVESGGVPVERLDEAAIRVAELRLRAAERAGTIAFDS